MISLEMGSNKYCLSNQILNVKLKVFEANLTKFINSKIKSIPNQYFG